MDGCQQHPGMLANFFFTASALQWNSAPLIIENALRADHLDQFVVAQELPWRDPIDGMLQYGAGLVAAVL
jgi:hypothetical protein